MTQLSHRQQVGAQTPPGTLDCPQVFATHRRYSLGYAGVAFELSCPTSHDFELGAEDTGACATLRDGHAVAQLECKVRWADGELLKPVGMWPLEPNRRGFVGLGTRGELTRVGPGRYRAELSVIPTSRGCGAALRMLAGMVLESEGSLCVHAAALEFADGAVLFTGPSGAGKSTACNLVPGGRCLAYDHVAIIPTEDGYRVLRFPMGKPSELPLTGVTSLPLRGILRVGRGEPAPAIITPKRSQAMFDVRAAVEVADRDPVHEAGRLAAVFRLCASVPVGRINTVLGQPIDGLLRSWLRAEPSVARELRCG